MTERVVGVLLDKRSTLHLVGVGGLTRCGRLVPSGAVPCTEAQALVFDIAACHSCRADQTLNHSETSNEEKIVGSKEDAQAAVAVGKLVRKAEQPSATQADKDKAELAAGILADTLKERERAQKGGE